MRRFIQTLTPSRLQSRPSRPDDVEWGALSDKGSLSCYNVSLTATLTRRQTLKKLGRRLVSGLRARAQLCLSTSRWRGFYSGRYSDPIS